MNRFRALILLGYLALALAYELSGCLWVPIGIHCVFNGIMAAGMILSNPNSVG